MAQGTWYQRLLRYEPGVSVGQWFFDRITNNWQALISIFGGGAVMGYLAAITSWINSYGPAGIGLFALFSMLVIWIGLAIGQNFRAGARKRAAEATAIEKWKEEVDNVNPLDPEFTRRRMRVLDLANPVTSRIEGKRFIDCDLHGPANLFFQGKTNVNGTTLHDCDVVIARKTKSLPMNNVVWINNCNIIGGTIYKSTLIVPQSMVPMFAGMKANIITLTGDQNVDKALADPEEEQKKVDTDV